MKSISIIIVILGIILTGQATGNIYRYVDDSGYANFTNDFSIVPPGKRSEITEYIEIPYTYKRRIAKKTTEIISTVPSQHPQPQRHEQLLEKQQLEAEYQGLLKEKEALDNNKSFQKRRIKRKYKHRPYMKKLLEKEEIINQRLAEIEVYLNA